MADERVIGIHYFDHQFLRKADFETAQNYHVDRLKQHNRLLHLPGVVDGLAVTRAAGSRSVAVSLGRAIDRHHREVVLRQTADPEAPTLVRIQDASGFRDIERHIAATETALTIDLSDPFPQGDEPVYLSIYFSQKETTASTDPGVVGHNTRLEERPVIEVSTTPPSGAQPHLLLGRLNRNSDGTIDGAPDLSGRVFASARLADGAVTSAKIAEADGTAGQDPDTGSGVKTSHLQDNAVTAAKLQAHLSDDAQRAVTTNHIRGQAVSGDKIARDTVQRDNLHPTLRNLIESGGAVTDATGVVEFQLVQPGVTVFSSAIDPGLGEQPLSVILGLETTQIFLGPSALFQTFNAPQALLGAVVDPRAGRFQVGLQLQGQQAAAVRVRWWAFKALQDRGTVIVPPGIAVSITPLTITLDQQEQRQFTAAVTGTSNPAVTWSVQEGTTGGAINATTGLYTAPNRSGTFHVVAALQADSTRRATAEVTIRTVSISVTPPTVTLDQGAQRQFSAEVLGAANRTVAWSIEEGATGGAINATTGLYTAPNRSGTFHVVATSQADPTRIARATIAVAEVAITIAPPSGNVFGGNQLQFQASVSGTTNQGVTWSVNDIVGGNASVGTITPAGLYAAPATGPTTSTVTVRGRSLADTSKVASATVTVNIISVTISPTSPSVNVNNTLQFSAVISGTSDQRVIWSVNNIVGGNSTLGTINTSGLYRAPTTIPGASVTVRVQSAADTSKVASATVTLVDPKGAKDTKDAKDKEDKEGKDNKDAKEAKEDKDGKNENKENKDDFGDKLAPEQPRLVEVSLAARQELGEESTSPAPQLPVGQAFIRPMERPDVGGAVLRGRD
jgi:hypothetical protein